MNQFVFVYEVSIAGSTVRDYYTFRTGKNVVSSADILDCITDIGRQEEVEADSVYIVGIYNLGCTMNV